MSRRLSLVGISPEELASPPRPPLLAASRRSSLLHSPPIFAADCTALGLPIKRASIQHSSPGLIMSLPSTLAPCCTPGIIAAQPSGAEAAPKVRGCCGSWLGCCRALRLLAVCQQF